MLPWSTLMEGAVAVQVSPFSITTNGAFFITASIRCHKLNPLSSLSLGFCDEKAAMMRWEMQQLTLLQDLALPSVEREMLRKGCQRCRHKSSIQVFAASLLLREIWIITRIIARPRERRGC